jgi:hypothetical protein
MLWSKLLATAHLAAMLQAEPILIVNFSVIASLLYRAGQVWGFAGIKVVHDEE